MKIKNIPAYAYFSNVSYPIPYYILCDDGLLAKYITVPQSPLWSESGETYSNIGIKCNKILGAPVFSNNYKFYQVYNSASSQPSPEWYARIRSDFNISMDYFSITDDYIISSATNIRPDSVYALNNDPIKASDYMIGTPYLNLSFYNGSAQFPNSISMTTLSSPTRVRVVVQIGVYPETLFVNNVLISKDDFDNLGIYPLQIRLTATYTVDLNNKLDELTSYSLDVTNFKNVDNPYNALKSLLSDFHTTNAGIIDTDLDDNNPYGTDGTSGPGGGNGTLPSGSLDSIDPAEIPSIPSISAADLGFITIYNPSAADLKALSSYMWSTTFDLATYKKLFSDPMQSIIGLAIVPVAPSVAGKKNVMFGTIDSGINMPYLSTNYVQLDCGSVNVERYIGCFMDNDPYTKISIYLPFIGIRQLSADDIIGGSIHVVYNIDVLTGACACFIEHETRGVLYSYNGSCITNVPLTAINFSGAIQNAVTTIGSAVGLIAGMSSGAAPITAMSAVGLATSAANTAINSKPSVQRSGNLGGSAGILSIMKPYVIIERPDISVPNNVQHFIGQTSNITIKLGECSGFTMCEYVHIDGVSATSEEIVEIESLLKAGVIL